MNLLHTIGLMTRAEHEAWQRQRDDIYKRAATDLAAQAEEIDKLKSELGAEALVIADLHRTIADLRPDAEAMRKKRAADRKRMAGKRNG